MNAKNIASSLRAVGGTVPCWIWGPPGIGKSRIVADWAKDVGELRDLRACLLESVDLRGLPTVKDDSAVWLPPEFLPRSGSGVLFLDELAQAPIPVQNACLQLALDRRVGEYRLPDGWAVVAASNRVEDRAGANRVTSALLSRFCHLDLDVSTDDWLEWAVQEGISPEVRSFIAWRPALLHDAKAVRDQRSFPCPRSYEFVSRVLPKIPSPECERSILSGLLGEGTAGEFLAFRRLFGQLPDADTLIADAKHCGLPTEPSVTHALIGVLVDKLKGATAKVQDAIATIFSRLSPEFAVVGFKQVFAAGIPIQTSPAGKAWFAKNRSLIIS